MTLATRMWLFGAALPTAVLLLGLLGAGQVFRAALESALDRALLAQASSETVSQFDGADGPHLHTGGSPLLETVRAFAPTAELFDAQGQLVAHFPEVPEAERAPAPSPAGPLSELATREGPGGRVRELVVRHRAPSGEPFALRLSASLAQLDLSVLRFHQVALAVVGLTGLVLVAVQLFFARRLAGRLAQLKQHLARVEQGHLDDPPPPDAGRDEVAELRGVLAGATLRLKQAREAQDRLLAEAAHELRTPLSLTRTSLDLALRRERSPAELKEAIAQARDEVDRLTLLATNLLKLGAAERSWDLADGDLAALVDEAAEAARAEAEQRGVWFEVIGPRPFLERFSAVALRQAVDNLLANALRFAPRGTPIRLELSRGEGVCRVAVSDRGPGIPPEQRQAVFAPFHRLDKRGGSGLGLAIVSQVARLHGGRALATEPGDGGGARVVIELPCP